MKYQLGEKAQVVKNFTTHNFNIGEIIEVVQVRVDDQDYKCSNGKHQYFLVDDELQKIEVSKTAYNKLGEFQTVGELKKLLDPFRDEMPIGFINQPKQDLYLSIDLEHGSNLGFQ